MIRARLHGDSPTVVAQELAKQIPAGMAKAIIRIAQEGAGELASESRARLAKRPTGRLSRSFKARFVTQSNLIVSAEAVSTLPYANIQDEGGTQTPKKGKYLAIPWKGVPRGKGPRDFGKLRFVPLKNGNALFVEDTKGGKFRPRFTLAKQVKIRGTHYVDAALKNLIPRIPEIVDPEFGKVIEASIQKASGRAGK